MDINRREYDDLRPGDIIWANSIKIGPHVHILIEKVSSEIGFECVNTINLTSNCGDCEENCISIQGKTIPEAIFGEDKTTDISYIRLSKPICISNDEYVPTSWSYKGNLKQAKYKDFWDEICKKCTETTVSICDCG